jgi:DNA-binding beta-propeller fold protein YncE
MAMLLKSQLGRLLAAVFLIAVLGLASAQAAAAAPTAAAATAAAPSHAAGHAAADTTGLRDVLLAGNAVAGTVSFIDGHSFQNLGSFSVIPDLQQVFASWGPVQWANYAVATADEATVDPSVGGTRYLDDMAVSPDGTVLYVSRANLDDVAAFNLLTHQELWRSPVAGIHADHMALSPDGTRVVVSATTAQEAQVFDASTGAQVGTFATGTYPHQNQYTADGRYIYDESIGITALPVALNSLKGQLRLEKVDAATLQVVKVWPFPYGVRPFVIAPDGTTMYTDLSYLNGFVKYDLNTSRTLATVQQPFSPAAAAESKDSYPQNSAHHGIALSGDGTKLCDVGTIDDYTKIVSTSSLSTTATVSYPSGSIPYWATTSADGSYCFVALSAGNAVSVISYATGAEVARVPVGNFPQRERLAEVPQAVLAGLAPAAG